MQELVKIIVAHHKPGLVISDDVYLPVQVGAALARNRLDMQGDDTGDNISTLNPIYCEMTAVYWAWKNLPQSVDYIGLCHYRRYFTFDYTVDCKYVANYFKYLKVRYFGRIRHPEVDLFYSRQLRVSDNNEIIGKAVDFRNCLEKRLKNGRYDLVIPEKFHHSTLCLEQFFSLFSGRHVIDVLCSSAESVNPVFAYFLRESLRETSLYAANMFIMKRELFDEYCSLIFDILNRQRSYLEQEGWCLDISSEKNYSRISGYMAELLTNAFIKMTIREEKKYLVANILFCDNNK